MLEYGERAVPTCNEIANERLRVAVVAYGEREIDVARGPRLCPNRRSSPPTSAKPRVSAPRSRATRSATSMTRAGVIPSATSRACRRRRRTRRPDALEATHRGGARSRRRVHRETRAGVARVRVRARRRRGRTRSRAWSPGRVEARAPTNERDAAAGRARRQHAMRRCVRSARPSDVRTPRAAPSSVRSSRKPCARWPLRCAML